MTLNLTSATSMQVTFLAIEYVKGWCNLKDVFTKINYT